MEEIRNLVAANQELIAINHHRIVFDDSILLTLMSVGIVISFGLFYLFIVFRRDVNEKLSKVEVILQKAEEALLLVREHSLNASEQRKETKRTLIDIKGDSERTQTMVITAIEEAAAKAAALIAASPVAPGATEANPIQVHLT